MPALRLLGLAFVLLAAAPADAFLVLSTEDLCAADEDPCILDEPVEVVSALPLDFGLRTLRVTGAGRMQGSVDIACGAFVANVPGRWMQLEYASIPRTPDLRIVARRACSGDPSLPCLTDADCEARGSGACTQGDGGIRIFGELVGVPGGVRLEAAGDVALAGRIRIAGKNAGEYGGSVDVRSSGGSIDVYAPINASAGRVPPLVAYNPAGSIRLDAARDLGIHGRLRVGGGYGWVDLLAGGDFLLEASVLGRGDRILAYGGADVLVKAGGDLHIRRDLDGRRTRIDLKGGSNGYEGGPGGEGSLEAGGDLVVAEGSLLRSDGGFSHDPYYEDDPGAGPWELKAGGDLLFDGTLSAKARGYFGEGQDTLFSSNGSITLGPSTRIDMRSPYGAGLELDAYHNGAVRIDGRIDLNAGIPDYPGPDGFHGDGGSMGIYGGDVEFHAVVATGGDESGGDFWARACRMHIGSAARIDASGGEQFDYPANVSLDVSGRLVADAGSLIAGRPDGDFRIYYGESARPPRLLGTVIPDPELVAGSPFGGCPVCGNSVVEDGESCDDGNAAAGDGCSDDCLLE